MTKQKSYTIIWDRIALDDFKDILIFLSKQSSQAPQIVRKGVISRLGNIEKNPLVFEIDRLKEYHNEEFRAFVIYNLRITYQVNEATKEIRILRIRHTSREPLGY